MKNLLGELSMTGNTQQSSVSGLVGAAVLAALVASSAFTQSSEARTRRSSIVAPSVASAVTSGVAPVISVPDTSGPVVALSPMLIDPKLSFEDWLTAESDIAFTKLLANVTPQGTAKGVVIASPSRHDPDYYFHWTRDAALVMDVIVRDYMASSGDQRLRWWRQINDYVDFSRGNQLSNAITGLGEPKFFVDGRPFDGEWGRPQNDGPALRALTLMRFAQQQLIEGQSAYVRNKLYDGVIPATTVIKSDLEYVAHHWTEQNFDLWEEVKADHFYTRLQQYEAMREGANLARQMGDAGAGTFYDEQAEKIRGTLGAFYDAGQGYFKVTLNAPSWGDRGKQGLDSAVILAVLHSHVASGDFSLTDSRVLSTAERLDNAFGAIYAINDPKNFPSMGNAIGRYPEDVFEGNNTNRRGNPWVLATAGFAEFYYKLTSRLKEVDTITVDGVSERFFHAVSGANLAGTSIRAGLTIKRGSPEHTKLLQDLLAKGDNYLKRVRFHSYPDGSLDEQIQRDTGYMTSAHDLTWSYASLITSKWARP